METMTEQQTLEAVKQTLGITGTYQDETLKSYIDEVKDYLVSAGVSQDVVSSRVSLGIISRGVSDLWNYGSGGTELSVYFMQRATQLALRKRGV